jgi:hypothetical protein
MTNFHGHRIVSTMCERVRVKPVHHASRALRHDEAVMTRDVPVTINVGAIG